MTNAMLLGGDGCVYDVQRSSYSHIILTCENYQEKLILQGHVEDWRSKRTIIVCEEGHKLTVDGRADEKVLAAS